MKVLLNKNTMDNKLILGIDLGTTGMGYGVVRDGSPGSVLECGIVPVISGGDLSMQLNDIHKYLTELIEKYNPDYIAFEDVFFIKNKKTALDIASARGVVLLVASQTQTEILKYTPLQVKQALTGYGRADKKQVEMMVKSILKLEEVPKPDDVSDALAIAICCLHSI